VIPLTPSQRNTLVGKLEDSAEKDNWKLSGEAMTYIDTPEVLKIAQLDRLKSPNFSLLIPESISSWHAYMVDFSLAFIRMNFMQFFDNTNNTANELQMRNLLYNDLITNPGNWEFRSTSISQTVSRGGEIRARVIFQRLEVESAAEWQMIFPLSSDLDRLRRTGSDSRGRVSSAEFLPQTLNSQQSATIETTWFNELVS
jgi:hypothetical protein